MSGLSDQTTQRQTTRPRKVTVALFHVHVHHSVVEQNSSTTSLQYFILEVLLLS